MYGGKITNISSLMYPSGVILSTGVRKLSSLAFLVIGDNFYPEDN